MKKVINLEFEEKLLTIADERAKKDRRSRKNYLEGVIEKELGS